MPTPADLDRRFTLIVIVLLCTIVSGTILTAMKVIPADTMTHMLATIVGLVGGALTLPQATTPPLQTVKVSNPPPENRS